MFEFIKKIAENPMATFAIAFSLFMLYMTFAFTFLIE